MPNLDQLATALASNENGQHFHHLKKMYGGHTNSVWLLKDKTKIIGVGGVSNGQDAFEKIISGATLVQLYTGMVYRGPRIASKISTELIDLLKNKGFKNVSEAIGTKN